MIVTDYIKLPIQSVPITTKVVSWSPLHGKVYSIQHYVIQFVSKVVSWSPVHGKVYSIQHYVIQFVSKVVSWSPVHGKVYSIQHYVIKFVSKVATGRWFSPGIQVSYNSKTDHQDITEMLLKVVLNTINQTIHCKIIVPYVIHP
jgi:pectin methylesterase-like acyl-CoA thioesterase